MIREKLFDILLKPHVSEKASKSSVENCRQYAFKVAKKANKHDVKQAVEKAFGVAVKSINICNSKSVNATQFGKVVGKRAAWKKAYVVLQAGQEINLA